MDSLKEHKEQHKALAIIVPNAEISKMRKKLASYFTHVRRIDIVVPHDSNSKKMIVVSSTPKEMYSGYESCEYVYETGYDDLSYVEAVKLLLKGIKEPPTSFETVGHIAHVNLRTDLLEYKKDIGQIIIDKNPNIRCVVNKEQHIDSKFREFKMDVIAGEADFKVTMVEHGSTFEFDYSKVYWNSRLATEHIRLAGLFKPKEIVVDMFAGVGPFAIPSAKRGCVVYANDLNPVSYEYLIKNAKHNSVSLNAYNLDAREFIKSLKDLEMDHVIMNLPKTATEFLDVFVDLFPSPYRKIICHCYCFCKKKNGVDDAKQLVCEQLGKDVDFINVVNVRDVSPSKDMFCVTFYLPKSCWKNDKRKDGSSLDSEISKKQKLEE